MNSSEFNSTAPFADNSQYMPFGPSYGDNAMLNVMLQGLIGHNYRPRPFGAQGQMDAYIQKERSLQFMKIQRQAFSSSLAMQLTGLSGSKVGSIMGQLLGSPDGLASSLLSPLMGGNPVATQMGLFADLSGAVSMGAFGRVTPASVADTDSVMRTMNKNFYKWKPVDKSFRDEQEQRVRKMIDTSSDEYLRQVFPGKSREDLKNYSFSANVGKHNSDVYGRHALASQLESQIGALQAYENSDGKDELLKKAAKEATDTIAKVYKEAGKDLGKGMALDAKGMATVADMRARVSDLRKINSFEELALERRRLEKEGKVFAGINFENTRGLTTEQFGSAFASAAQLHALGAKGSTYDKSDQFERHSGGALSAAASLIGRDRKGGDYVQLMRDLIGTGDLDLTTATGANEAEQLLRKVKSTARVAGVSIEVLLGIIKSTKEVARNTPGLEYMSAMSSTRIGMEAVKSAASVGVGLSAKQLAQAGGTQSIAANIAQESLMHLNSDTGGTLSALYARFKNDTKGAVAYDIIDRYAKEGLNGENVSAMMSELSEATGISPATLWATSKNEMQRALGRADPKIEGRVKGSIFNSVMADMSQYLTNSDVQDQDGNPLTAENLLSDIVKSGLTVRDYSTQKFSGYEELQKFFMANQGSILEQLDRVQSPETAALLDKTRDEYSAIDARMDKLNGRFNAGILTQLSDAALSDMNTPLSATKIKNVLSSFLVDDSVGAEEKKIADTVHAGLKDMYEATNLGTPAERNEALAAKMNAHLGKMGYKDVAVTADMVSAESLAAIKDKSLDEVEGDYEELLKKSPADLAKDKAGDTRLRQYRLMDKLGVLKSQEAFKLFTSGTQRGEVAAIGQLQIEAGRERNAELGVAEQVNTFSNTLDKMLLGSDANASEGAALIKREYTREDGSFDIKQFSEDATGRTGIFMPVDPDGDGPEEAVSPFTPGQKYGVVGKASDQLIDAIGQAKNADAAAGKTTEDHMAPLQALVRELMTSLNQSGLAGSLDKLGTAVSQLVGPNG